MTSSEISMLGEILKLHMEAAIIKAVAPLQEELKKIKALNAAILKEGRQQPAQVGYRQDPPTFSLLGKANSTGIITEGNKIQQVLGHSVYDDPSLKMIANNAQASGGLPDIDLPVPGIFK